MRKLLEIKSAEETRRSQLLLYTFMLLTTALFVLVSITEKSFFEFSFYPELIFIVAVLRFFARAYINKNYAFWGLSLVLSFYLFLNILHYTFLQHNIFILYISFLATLFLVINCYVMSSPLYFPRVQWWEYDFRYRGELKAFVHINGEVKESRLTDLRRDCANVMAFDQLRLGEEIEIDIPFDSRSFTIKGELKTAREDIPGRPIRYGLKLILKTDEDRKSLLELQKVWNMQKRAMIRRKFAELKK